MARIEPLRALRYDLTAVGSLDAVAAPPYDVIDEPLRERLAARSPFNVVEIDLPKADGGDPYLVAQTTLEAWLQQGVITREREPSIWALTQEYTAPPQAGGGATSHTRHGFLCRVRVEDYGAGRIRPHERTHPGPKEDRLRLTRATRANLSPIFSLFPDPDSEVWAAIEPATNEEPFATTTDFDGTVNRLWRIGDESVIEVVKGLLGPRELLIADGHHRYETARIYAEEVGGEGEHRHVLMFLCSLSDSGLTVFPTHRLLTGLDEPRQMALREAIMRDFEAEKVAPEELQPPPDLPGIVFGYMDSFHRQPYRLTLKDVAVADRALEGRPEPYRRLETAVLEALMLRGALGMSEDDISHKRGLDYSSDFGEAREAIESGRFDAGFFLRATPVEQVREVAEAGESMPPKSTFFFPKVPTGLVFNPLD